MGQEISIQNKCNKKKQPEPKPEPERKREREPEREEDQDHYNHFYEEPYEDYRSIKEKQHQKESFYNSSSTSNASTTDDEYYKYCQKYNLTRQSYEKSKIFKTQQQRELLVSKNSLSDSIVSDSSVAASTTTTTATTTSTTIDKGPKKLKHFYELLQKRHHKPSHSSSQSSIDSGIYYTPRSNSISTERRLQSDYDSRHVEDYRANCNYSLGNSLDNSAYRGRSSSCSKRAYNSDIARSPDSTVLSKQSGISSKSIKSLQQQKHYLDHHLYIKSYLDILEEDERAQALYPKAKAGGIRNYTPKILADSSLSKSAPSITKGFTRKKSLQIEDPWI